MNIYDNVTDIKREDLGTQYNNLPAGYHYVKIFAIEEKETTNKKTGNKGLMLVIGFENNLQQQGFIRLNVKNSSEIAVEIAFTHLKQILTMIPKPFRDNFNNTKNPVDLMGATFHVFGRDSTYQKDGEIKKTVDFVPDSKKALEIFNNDWEKKDDFNDAPLDKYNPFDDEPPF